MTYSLLVMILICACICIRAHYVCKHRIELTDKMLKRNIKDIDNGITDIAWRQWEKNKADFHKMVFMFWKPLNSFCDEEKILK